MERMSKEELNKRKRQKNYYLLVEKTTLYDHRNLKKKWGLQMFKSYVELPAAQLHTFFFSNCFTFKNCHFFFQKQSCLFQKIPPEKTHTIFFLFPFDSVAFRKFYLQKMKNCPKKFTKHFSSSKLTFKIYRIVLVFFLK